MAAQATEDDAQRKAFELEWQVQATKTEADQLRVSSAPGSDNFAQPYCCDAGSRAQQNELFYRGYAPAASLSLQVTFL